MYGGRGGGAWPGAARTFGPGLGCSLGLLEGQQQAVQKVQEALQDPAVIQGSLANAGQQHEDPGTRTQNRFWFRFRDLLHLQQV